jgi:hypothetical protein
MCIDVTEMTRLYRKLCKNNESCALKYSSDIHNYNTRNKQNLHLERFEKNWDKQTSAAMLSTTGTVPAEHQETEQFASSKIEPNRNVWH